MNPFLASAIILILRWLQFIAANQVLPNNTLLIRELQLDNLLDDSQRFSNQLSDHCLSAHQMSDSNSDKKVM